MKIRVNLISALCLAAGFASSVAVAKPDAAPPAREAIEWCDIWISHANESNLPRVLLIGDSIARDYYPEVEKRLAGKAFVARLTTLALRGRPGVAQRNRIGPGWHKVRCNPFQQRHAWLAT